MDIADGWYRSRIVRCSIGQAQFEKPVSYVSLFFELLEVPHQGKTIEWRGSITNGAMTRTRRILYVCGAEMKNDDLYDWDGLGQSDVSVQIQAIDSPEAPGTIQVFVIDVKPLT
jgi:hypothetical protein